MLPSLKKGNDKDFTATETKVYDPPRELGYFDHRKEQVSRDSNRNSSKVKVGGGFKLGTSHEESNRGQSIRVMDSLSNYKSHNQALLKKSSVDPNTQIKLIERKIRQCQKKIQEEKRRKIIEDQRRQDDKYAQDFEKIIKRQLQLQGYKEEPKGFDYLTNPGGPPPEEQPVEEPQPPEPYVEPDYNIVENVQKLEKFYQNSLKKKFQRRQMFPHKACKRKTPKLYITQKTNALSKQGKPQNEDEHKFRIMSKETTPQEIYPVIPNFAVVKDNLSKNILAYLGDYKPFIDKTKERVEKEAKAASPEEIVIENANKSLTVSN